MNIPIPNMTSLPETTQKPPATERDHTGTYKSQLDSPGSGNDPHGTVSHLFYNYLSAPGATHLVTWCTQYELTKSLVATPTYISRTTKSPEERQERTPTQD